jgi:phospholipid-binding lipoprotein MlaA
MIFSSLLVFVQLAGGGLVPAAQPAQVADQPSDERAEQKSAPDPDVADRSKEGDQLPSAPEREVLADMTQAEGEIVVTAKAAAPRSDPMQALNRTSFKAVRSVDKAVTGPLARGYKKTIPSPVRGGVRNALRNLGEPVVVMNYMLQLKPGKSLETLGRLAINSTVGVAGLFDVAKKRPFNLPYHPNGLAYTLGYYGMKPGPYMYLPLIGPTTVRDLAGRVGDISLLPVVVGRPFSNPVFAVPATVIRLVDERAEADDALRENMTGNADPYSATRSKYLIQRQNEIDDLKGRGKKE